MFRPLSQIRCAALRAAPPRFHRDAAAQAHATRSALRAFDLAAVAAATPEFGGVAALPIGEATARGVSEGVLAHDAHNSYHAHADAGRLYELEMREGTETRLSNRRGENVELSCLFMRVAPHLGYLA